MASAARLPALVLAALCACAQASAPEDYQPEYGQEGKDVVWIPTPESMVEAMLTTAGVTARDLVVDLGSGDGRIVIAAAKRGARALGIEYEPGLVEVSRRAAREAGVSGRAEFVQGDIFEADFSQATVVAVFLTPDLLLRLRPKLLALRPGTRIVSNTFLMPGWEPDAAADGLPVDGCDIWCSAFVWIVPANVAGTYDIAHGQVRFKQRNQILTGVLRSGGRMLPLEGRVLGEKISFRAGGREYHGRVSGGRLELR